MEFRSQLAQRLHDRYGFTKKDASVIYDIFMEGMIEYMSDEIEREGKISVEKFGTIWWKIDPKKHSIEFNPSNKMKQDLNKRWKEKREEERNAKRKKK